MDSQRDWKGRIRILLYPAMFETDPVCAVDRVIESIRSGSLTVGTPAEMRNALEQALASPEPLVALLPQTHSEEAIRRYLAELLRRLSS
jgi:hypothetical protein